MRTSSSECPQHLPKRGCPQKTQGDPRPTGQAVLAPWARRKQHLSYAQGRCAAHRHFSTAPPTAPPFKNHKLPASCTASSTPRGHGCSAAPPSPLIPAHDAGGAAPDLQGSSSSCRQRAPTREQRHAGRGQSGTRTRSWAPASPLGLDGVLLQQERPQGQGPSRHGSQPCFNSLGLHFSMQTSRYAPQGTLPWQRALRYHHPPSTPALLMLRWPQQSHAPRRTVAQQKRAVGSHSPLTFLWDENNKDSGKPAPEHPGSDAGAGATSGRALQGALSKLRRQNVKQAAQPGKLPSYRQLFLRLTSINH